MKIHTSKFVIVSAALLSTLALPVLAQTPDQSNQKQTVQEPVVPAPTTQPLPRAGESSPLRKGEDVPDPGQSAAAAGPEVDDKAKQPSDADFLKESAISSATEIGASQLAAQQATNPKVKAYAASLVTYYGKMNADLKSIAGQKNVELPQAPDAKRQVILDKLSKIDAAKFDKAYIEQVLHDQQELVQYYQRQAKFTKDPAVKSYIASEFPALKKRAVQASALYTASNTK